MKRIALGESIRISYWRNLPVLAGLALLLGVVPQLEAATFTWTNLVSGNASGSWATQANWSGVSLPTSGGDSADFSTVDLTADSTITLDGDQSINGLAFGDTMPSSAAGWTVASGTPVSSTLTLGGASPTITVNALGGTKLAIINTPIAGYFVKKGTGKLQLGGTNLLTGQTTINAGTLLTAYSVARTMAGSLSVSAGAIFQENSSGAVVTFNGSFTGNGSVNIYTMGVGQTVIGGDNSAFAGTLSIFRFAKLTNAKGLGGPSTIVHLDRSVANAYVDLNGLNVSNVNASFTGTGAAVARLRNTSATAASFAGNITNITTGGVDGSGDLTLSGTISGSGGLIMAGNGTLTLTGTNTYSGGIAVNSGTLLVNGDNSGSSAAITVAAGATLGGSGQIGGDVTFASGAGAKAVLGAPLVISGALTLNSNTVDAVIPGSTPLAVGRYTLMTYGGALSGSFNAAPVIGGAGLAPHTQASIQTESGVVSLVVATNTPPPVAYQYLLLNWNDKDGSASNLMAYVQQKFGAANQSSALKVGVSVIYLGGLNTPKFVSMMTNDLAVAQSLHVPILIQVDTEDFLPTSLLNWYDSTLPGYDPAKAADVEWYGWDASTAVKLCWRNWGSEIRVGPRPNWLSPNFQAFEKNIYTTFIPAVTQWYNSLSSTQQWLFVGWKCGWESSLHTGYRFFTNGNSYYGTTNDPAWTSPDEPLGYNAAQTASPRTSGTLTTDDECNIVGMHLTYLASLACTNGIPRSKVFVHGVAQDSSQQDAEALVNPHANPGCSWYGSSSSPLAADTNFMQAVYGAENNYGAAGYGYGEFNLFATDYTTWYNWLQMALRGDPHCRYQALYNYGSMRGVSSVEQAMLDVMALYPQGPYTWTNLVSGNASGSWATQANWSGVSLPTSGGDAADFTSLDLTADSTITLDGDQTINALAFGDTGSGSAAGWTLSAGSPANSKLTLAGPSPTIIVNGLAGGKQVNITVAVAGTLGFTKAGSGTLQLAGTNPYSGATTVSAGTLLVNGSIGGSGVSVLANACLGGNGVILSAVTGASGSALGPGFSLGTLIISNNLTLNPGAVLRFELNWTNSTARNDYLVVSGTLNVAGATLSVTNLGPALVAGNRFKLLSQPSGGFTAVSLPPLDPGLNWTNNLAVDGSIAVVGPAPAPANLTWAASGRQLVLTWPAGQGWLLQSQTNSLGAGLTTNWFTVPGATPPYTNGINAANPTVFYRLKY